MFQGPESNVRLVTARGAHWAVRGVPWWIPAGGMGTLAVHLHQPALGRDAFRQHCKGTLDVLLQVGGCDYFLAFFPGVPGVPGARNRLPDLSATSTQSLDPPMEGGVTVRVPDWAAFQEVSVFPVRLSR